MANTSKHKGTRWESAVVSFLQLAGFPEARRNAQYGTKDIGDIGGFDRWAIECKDHASIPPSKLAEFIEQARREAGHAHKPFGVAVVKHRRHTTSSAFVLMDLETFALLERYIRELEAE